MSLETPRRQLAEFLKGCRARLLPQDVGLPSPRRRRTPGLRREDVAALAGVSVTWYTWLEQGRDIRVSAKVLEQISSTLRMSTDEREYLFGLVQHRPAPMILPEDEQVSDELQRMLDAINVPAQVMTGRWDVIGWNQLYSKLIRDYSQLRERNLLKLLLIDEKDQQTAAKYEETARRVLARFRVDYSQMADDLKINELVDELSESCPIFSELWESSEVTSRSYGINAVRLFGGVAFEHSSYVPEGSPNLRVLVYVPHDAPSQEKVAELYAVLRAEVGRGLN